ncbi:MAG: HAMP domain-containing histidine kinase [Saprospiraceae bacterium]|nr:HAMP domain-containing histidine kinase [Saprospiraceae bacterium]MCB9324412.1 HAMP domain-containing histidine kinase [Lewinellaceae bacterium]
MSSGIIKRVIILGVLALTGIVTMQTYWVLSAWSIHEEEFNKKVNLALFNTAKDIVRINNGTLPSRDIIKRKTSNYYIVNIENEVNADYLEYVLQKEFEHLALNIDFEYAVFDCHTDEMVYGNYCRYSPDAKVNAELGNLPKDSQFTYYFGVKFPTLPGYLIGKMQLSIFFSVLMLLTVIFFAYSMFVILRQKRLSEQQKDFINNMTHEFKTPISTIKISSDVFLNHPGVQADDRLFQYASIIHEQNQRLNNQVEKVLQISRIEKGGLEIKPELLDFSILVKEALKSCDARVDNLHGHLNTIIEEPLWIKADKLHLTNILHNLFDNAIKYCKKAPDIEVVVDKKNNFVYFKICDKGIGIPKEYQPKIFEKFFRVPTGNIHNVKGFGLGLYYVKSICRAHHWKIEMKSEEGEGTCFQIRIPEALVPAS